MPQERGPDIKVNGRKHATIIDSNGVQRFKPNGAIKWLTETADLNHLWVSFLNKAAPITRKDMRQLYRLMGYSICGYKTIFPKDKIENPLWNK